MSVFCNQGIVKIVGKKIDLKWFLGTRLCVKESSALQLILLWSAV